MPALIGQSSNIKSSLALILAVLAIFVAIAMRSTPCAYAASGSCSVGDLEVFTSAITVNEDGNDADTRFEGDTNQNLWYLDAGNDRIGLGTSAPSAFFDVRGISSFGDNNITNVADVSVDSISADASTIAISDDTTRVDNNKSIFGTGGDLEIYFDATQGIIDPTFTDIGGSSVGVRTIGTITGTAGGGTRHAGWQFDTDITLTTGNASSEAGIARVAPTTITVDAGTQGIVAALILETPTTAGGGSVTETYNAYLKGDSRIDGVWAILNSGDPATLANASHIYAKDDAASSEIHVRDEAGNVTKISPHSGDQWFFESCNDFSGKCVSVDMEKAMLALELLIGEEIITISYNPPKLDWAAEQFRLSLGDPEREPGPIPQWLISSLAANEN